ncbi:MAG: isocitrate lyase/phosphoenolpyruvate mutase family protein, partial [Reyranella sp.]|nr:isocitrate lyase/phosphoenolpyruvate mutase family protein [Reyranella sp.]
MTVSQADKARKFRALHEAPGAFVIPNPWDAGSARVLAGLGFEALATSSGAKAGVLGKRDGKVSREEALANARPIVNATDLPVPAGRAQGSSALPATSPQWISRDPRAATHRGPAAALRAPPDGPRLPS